MKYVKGCAIEAFKQVKEINGGRVSAVLFHQVNCFKKMGSGIAKLIREQFPEHYQDYLYELESDSYSDKEKLKKLAFGSYFDTMVVGENLYWYEGDIKFIVGLFGQFYYGRDKRHTNYAALNHALVSWFKSSNYSKDTQFIIPKNIGCGLAGGDWNVVELLLNEVETMFNIEFTICEL